MLNCVSCVPACQRGLRTKRACVSTWFTCQRACFPKACQRLIFTYAKSCARRAIRASVVYMPICPRANVSKVCRLLIFTCQRANKRANVPKACQPFTLACQPFTLACQRAKRRAIFSTSPAKRRANFLTTFQNNCIFS